MIFFAAAGDQAVHELCRCRSAQRGLTQAELHAVLPHDVNGVGLGGRFKRLCHLGTHLPGVLVDRVAQKGIHAFFRQMQVLGVMVGPQHLRGRIVVFQNREFVFPDHTIHLLCCRCFAQVEISRIIARCAGLSMVYASRTGRQATARSSPSSFSAM